mmetsp:Transcript_48964/g.116600  ORF Transcript_48964/g.116600 Transcript_48964/m.116600 type:complete len:502 (-) Transcript_48964:60-1565(-)
MRPLMRCPAGHRGTGLLGGAGWEDRHGTRARLLQEHLLRLPVQDEIGPAEVSKKRHDVRGHLIRQFRGLGEGAEGVLVLTLGAVAVVRVPLGENVESTLEVGRVRLLEQPHRCPEVFGDAHDRDVAAEVLQRTLEHDLGRVSSLRVKVALPLGSAPSAHVLRLRVAPLRQPVLAAAAGGANAGLKACHRNHCLAPPPRLLLSLIPGLVGGILGSHAGNRLPEHLHVPHLVRRLGAVAKKRRASAPLLHLGHVEIVEVDMPHHDPRVLGMMIHDLDKPLAEHPFVLYIWRPHLRHPREEDGAALERISPVLQHHPLERLLVLEGLGDAFDDFEVRGHHCRDQQPPRRLWHAPCRGGREHLGRDRTDAFAGRRCDRLLVKPQEGRIQDEQHTDRDRECHADLFVRVRLVHPCWTHPNRFGWGGLLRASSLALFELQLPLHQLHLPPVNFKALALQRQLLLVHRRLVPSALPQPLRVRELIPCGRHRGRLASNDPDPLHTATLK